MFSEKFREGSRTVGNSSTVTKGFNNLWDVSIRNSKISSRVTSSTQCLHPKSNPASSSSKTKEEGSKDNGSTTTNGSSNIQGSYDKNNEGNEHGGIPCGTGYIPLVQELHRAFLMRAGCPRFSNRSTSTSHWPALTTLSELPSGTYFKNVNYDNWKMSEDTASSSDILKACQTGSPLTYSKSACEFQYLKQSRSTTMEWSPSTQSIMKSSQTKKIPWYASVIQEKDRYLLMMGEEINRLTAMQENCLRKDDELAQLKEEVKELQKQLQFISEVRETEIHHEIKPEDTEIISETKPSKETSAHSTMAYEESDLQTESLTLESKDEGSKPCMESYDHFPIYDTRGVSISASIEKDEEEIEKSLKEASRFIGKIRKPPHLPPECYSETEAKIIEEDENVSYAEIEGIEYIDRELEEELMTKIHEYEQVNQELQTEIDILRNEYSIVTGTIMSLQRKVDFQESQLQKTIMEKEVLQKELRERKAQLQAMSDKFSSLREDRKHEEMMGIIEKDNLNLRQHVSELEFELGKREEVISEYDSKINHLEAQVIVNQNHMLRQLQTQENLQHHFEEVQHSEQQYRVALESCQARLERLRNKIMQAAFSTTGIKSPSSEITDNDILEGLQRIINERLEFYQQLKQKGVKVPPLHQNEISSAHKSKKGSVK